MPANLETCRFRLAPGTSRPSQHQGDSWHVVICPHFGPTENECLGHDAAVSPGGHVNLQNNTPRFSQARARSIGPGGPVVGNGSYFSRFCRLCETEAWLRAQNVSTRTLIP